MPYSIQSLLNSKLSDFLKTENKLFSLRYLSDQLTTSKQNKYVLREK